MANSTNAKNMVINCPCNTNTTKTMKILKCNNQGCNYGTWHAACAGFPKATQAFLNSIKEWLCPSCIIQKLPQIASITLEKDQLNKKYFDTKINDVTEKLLAIEKTAASLNLSMKEDQLNKGKLQNNFVQQMEAMKETICTKMENQDLQVKSYAETVSKNINESSKTNIAISSIHKHVENLKTDIKSKQLNDKENELRIAKEFNICIFNIPESKQNDKKQAFLDDIDKLHNILDQQVTIKKEDIKKVYRKKIKDENKPRPIIMTLNSKDIRAEILKLRDLEYKEFNDENIAVNTTKIFITTDKTKLEQEQHKKLVIELKERRKTEDNIVIRNGRIVKYQPFRADAQLYWA